MLSLTEIPYEVMDASIIIMIEAGNYRASKVTIETGNYITLKRVNYIIYWKQAASMCIRDSQLYY